MLPLTVSLFTLDGPFVAATTSIFIPLAIIAILNPMLTSDRMRNTTHKALDKEVLTPLKVPQS